MAATRIVTSERPSLILTGIAAFSPMRKIYDKFFASVASASSWIAISVTSPLLPSRNEEGQISNRAGENSTTRPATSAPSEFGIAENCRPDQQCRQQHRIAGD